METELKMTLKEADRLAIMKLLDKKKINLRKAPQEMGISYRHSLRIWQHYQREGPPGLISRQRGSPSNHQLSRHLKQMALDLVREKYADYGPTLAREKLAEKHELHLAKETLRQLMIKSGFWKPKSIKTKRVHPRRTRRSQFGELEQIDGSYEYWFEDRGEKCCLLVCVDDATSSLIHLRFCKAETTEDYLLFLRG